MQENYVLSYDVGTSEIKVVAVSLQGDVLGSFASGYETLFLGNNWVEQRPDAYWETVCSVTKQFLRVGKLPPKDCRGIIFCTQWTGIIPVDTGGRPLRNCMIWMDKRAESQAAALNAHFGSGIFCDSDYWPKLMWLRENEPEIYEKSNMILEINAWLKFRAAGTYTSDITDCFTLSPVADRQAFYKEILDFGQLDSRKFPPICRSSDMVGRITVAAALEIGLPAGTPVFGGCDDIAGLAIGVGCSKLGQTHAYLGTSGWLSHVIPAETRSVINAPLDEKNDICFLGLGASIGPSNTWLLRSLYPDRNGMTINDLWAQVTEEIAEIHPGADRLLVTPWLYGGRPPLTSSLARGVFLNLKESHRREHMVTAMLEGICFMLRQNTDRLQTMYHPQLHSLAICGGGARNPRWMQAMADILKLQIKVPKSAHIAGAQGAAYCALAGLGELHDFREIETNNSAGKVYDPNPDNFAEYDLLYHTFSSLYRTLEPYFRTLNTI